MLFIYHFVYCSGGFMREAVPVLQCQIIWWSLALTTALLRHHNTPSTKHFVSTTIVQPCATSVMVNPTTKKQQYWLENHFSRCLNYKIENATELSELQIEQLGL